MADGSVMTRTASVSDADVGRIIGWAMAYYPTEFDDNGAPIEKSSPWAIKRWVEAIVASSLAKVSAYETQLAVDAANASRPAPIAVKIT